MLSSLADFQLKLTKYLVLTESTLLMMIDVSILGDVGDAFKPYELSK